jgi:hypothetical protein
MVLARTTGEMMVHKIYVSLLPHLPDRKTADAYRVTFGSPDGEELVARTRSPFREGARALVLRGYSGPFEMWDGHRPFPRMKGDILRAAGEWLREQGGKEQATFAISKTPPFTKNDGE